MTRGFVTVATGKVDYYKQAYYMLKSFRLHNPEVKFAILCDRANEYTEEFDDVIVLSDAKCNYQDKARLLTDCPYDENIFIESDCIIYHNLDFFWDILSNQWDFTCFGWNDSSVDVWISSQECLDGICNAVGKKFDKVSVFNPGYLFIRNSENTKKMFDDISVMEKYLINNWYGDKKMFLQGNLRDDPLFCFAMAINGMRCAAKPGVGKCISIPTGYKILKLDITEGKLDVKDKRGDMFYDCSLLHFSSRRIREEGLYPWQICIVNAKTENCSDAYIRFLSSSFIKYTFMVERYIQTRIKWIIKWIFNK